MSSEYEGAQTNHENRVGSPLGNWDEFFEEIDWRDWSSRSSTAAVQFVRPVASYSWDIRAEPPRLHIPGAPRCIDLHDIGNMESAIGKSMAKDGVFPKDENQFRLRNESNGCFPTEPIFLAMHACSREGLECTLDDVDCICDSNTLCKLIAWMRGDSSIVTVSERNQEAEAVESFAFDMEMVGRKTLLLTRVEEDNIVQPNASKPTFGPSFEKLIGIVPQGFQHCSSFYRVSMIRIGELKVLVRSQVDAVNSGLPNERYIEENTWLEGLSEGSLQWRKCGSCVALTSDVIELKTKSAKAKSKQWAWNE